MNLLLIYFLCFRLSGVESLNIQFNGEANEEKPLNTSGAGIETPCDDDEDLATPPPIPPKSLVLNERRDSIDSVVTPSTVGLMENGTKNENYSVPRAHNK